MIQNLCLANIGLQPTLKKLESLVENAVEENAFDLDITKGLASSLKNE